MCNQSKFVWVLPPSEYNVQIIMSMFDEEALVIHCSPLPPLTEFAEKNNYIHCDTSKIVNIPIELIEPLIFKHISLENIIDIIPLAEPAVLACLKIKQKYSIAYSKNALEYNKQFLDKFVATQILNKYEVCPKSIKYTNGLTYLQICEQLKSSRFILKPKMGHSAFNTFLITAEDSFYNSLIQIKNVESEDFILQQYIEGDLYHCDFIIQDKQVKFFGLGKYNAPLLEFKNKAMLYTLILNVDDEEYQRLKEFSFKILDIFNPQDGAFHMEIFINHEDNQLYFLECANRLAGDGVIIPYNTVYQINLYELTIKVKAGIKIDKINLIRQKEATIIGFPRKKGIIKDYSIPSQLSGALTILKQIPIDTEVSEALSFSDVTMACLLVADSIEEIRRDLMMLESQIIVHYNQ